MKCHDFERAWNELLDAGDASTATQELELEVHAASCASCRVLGQRYQGLRTAIRHLPALPSAPEGFAERCLRVWEAERAASRVLPFRLQRPKLAPLAAAAAVLLAIGLGAREGWFSFAARDRAATVTTTSPAAVRLDDAFARATTSGLSLAVRASAPAARIGRDMIEETITPNESIVVSVAPSLDTTSSTASAAAVLQRVGDRVSDGVAPLSGTARNAFSFLMVPTRANKPAGHTL
jgi:hypothetical protein